MQALAKVKLPGCVEGTQSGYVLHPSVMDGALQASIGLMMGGEDSASAPVLAKLMLPFALEEFEVYGACPASAWVWVRYSEGHGQESKVSKLDVDVCDEVGRVCVRLKGFAARALEGKLGEGASGTLLLTPAWKVEPLTQAVPEHAAGDYGERWVMLCEPGKSERHDSSLYYKDYRSQLEAERLFEGRCLCLHGEYPGVEERFQSYASEIFAVIQQILKDRPPREVLLQVVIPTEGEDRVLFGLSGLLKTAHLENSKLIGQIIGIEPGEAPESVVRKLRENSHNRAPGVLRYEKDERLMVSLEEVAPLDEVEVPWKDGGVYLIKRGGRAA